MSLEVVEWAASWPLILPYFDGKVPSGFPSPAEDYLTNTFNNDPFYSNGASARFPETTNDIGEVVGLAVRMGERLFRDSFRYAKCCVMITELLPEIVRQPTLWSEPDRERRERVWKTVDRLNATLGRGTVRVLSAGPKDAAWKLRAEYRSPRWTTCWDEAPRLRV
jgi:DNA polymerase V